MKKSSENPFFFLIIISWNTFLYSYFQHVSKNDFHRDGEIFTLKLNLISKPYSKENYISRYTLNNNIVIVISSVFIFI